MKQLTCEMCGGTDLIKQDGVFVCQNCGMKYSVEEAKKMMIEGTVDVQGTVKVDNSAFVQKCLANARRAKQKEDWKETEKYYNLVEQNDPTNIEAIFYSTYAQVKSALLEAETKDKRQSVFNTLIKGVSVIDDNYDNTNKEHHKLIFEIMDDINGLKKGTIVPTTHLQEYVTKNGYGNIVDRNQLIENDSLTVTYNMIDKVIAAYEESIANIIPVQCKDLTKEEILEKARETLQSGYLCFALGYFDEYIKKDPESSAGYLGKAVTLLESGRYEDSVGYLDEYIKKNPESAVGYLGKAVVLLGTLNVKDSANEVVSASKYAVKESEKEYAKRIIEITAGFYSRTLLINAATFANYDAVKCLVDLGAEIDAKATTGTTALWHVCHETFKDKEDQSNARKIAKLLLDKGASVNVTAAGGEALYNINTDAEIVSMIKAKYPNAEMGKCKVKGGCYVATAVYGSYDCPQVWTLRRYRDYTLAETWYGRAFIRTYYAISPTLVKWFGHTEWFKNMWKDKLDRMVTNLKTDGFEDTPYEDKQW